MSSIPAPRRIVASNFSVSGSLGKLENSEPAVQVITEEVPIVSELDGNWYERAVFTHTTAYQLPTMALISA